MPFLAHADRLATGVSPFCACLLMVDLAMKCLNKTDHSDEGQNALEECFRDRMFAMQGIFEEDMLSRDPIALTTNLNMSAIRIILHNRTFEIQEVSGTAVENISQPHDVAMSIFNILKASWDARQTEVSPEPSLYPLKSFCTSNSLLRAVCLISKLHFLLGHWLQPSTP